MVKGMRTTVMPLAATSAGSTHDATWLSRSLAQGP